MKAAKKALRRQLRRRFGIGRILQNVPGLIPTAVRLGEIGVGPAGPRLGAVPVDHAGQAWTDDETIAGQAFGVPEQIAPGQFAVILLGQGQHRHRPRRAGRAP